MSSTFLLTRVYVVLHFLHPEVSSQELNSTLHTTKYGVHFAYDAEYIIFTCSTKDSNSIAWSSDEYIGMNGFRLEFASIEREGTARHATDNGAIAQLVNVSRENGKVILLSQLQISVQSRYQVASITCHSIGNDAVNTTTFRMADNASVTCDKPAVCPGETVTCACTTGHSNIIAWSSDQLIGRDGVRLEFASFQPLLTRLNVSDSSTFAVLIDSSDLNGVSVLESELAFVVSSTLDIILTCENVGRQISDSIIIPMARKCIPSTTSVPSTVIDDLTTTPAGFGNATIPIDVSHLSASQVIVLIIAFISIVVSSVIVIICLLLMYKIKKQRFGSHKARSITKIPMYYRTKDSPHYSDRCAVKSDSSLATTQIGSGIHVHVSLEKENPLYLRNKEMAMQDIQEEDEAYKSKSTQSEEEPECTYEKTETKDNLHVQEVDEAYKSKSIQSEEESELVIPTSETGGIHSYSVTRGCEVMECMDETFNFYKKMGHEVSLIEKLRELNKKLLEQLKEKEQQIAEFWKRETEMKQQIKEIQREKAWEMDQQKEEFQKIINEMGQQIKEFQRREAAWEMFPEVEKSTVNQDSVEANMVWNRDRLHVAHAGNFSQQMPSIPGCGIDVS